MYNLVQYAFLYRTGNRAQTVLLLVHGTEYLRASIKEITVVT